MSEKRIAQLELLILAIIAASVAVVFSSCTSKPETVDYVHEHRGPNVVLAETVERIHSEYDLFQAYSRSITVRLARLIRESATKQGIPSNIAFALVDLESDFIRTAVSPAGALGLTQVMPPTGLEHCGLRPDQLLQVELNLDCGFSFLSMLHARYDSWSLALAAYNVGPARLTRAHRTGEPNGAWYASKILGSL